jgi:hypothetical protein
MKTAALTLMFLMLSFTAFAQMLVEAPNGERRLRFELCDTNHNCRFVEQTVSYPVCDAHHNCVTVDAFETGKARVWEEDELMNRGFVFSAPMLQTH